MYTPTHTQLEFTVTDVDAMIRAFDANGRRKLNLDVSEAGTRCMHVHVPAHVRAHTQLLTNTHTNTHSQEFAKLHSFLTSVQSSFFYFDRDGGKTLDLNEVLQALRHAGEHWLSVCAFETTCMLD